MHSVQIVYKSGVLSLEICYARPPAGDWALNTGRKSSSMALSSTNPTTATRSAVNPNPTGSSAQSQPEPEHTSTQRHTTSDITDRMIDNTETPEFSDVITPTAAASKQGHEHAQQRQDRGQMDRSDAHRLGVLFQGHRPAAAPSTQQTPSLRGAPQ